MAREVIEIEIGGKVERVMRVADQQFCNGIMHWRQGVAYISGICPAHTLDRPGECLKLPMKEFNPDSIESSVLYRPGAM